MLDAEGLGEAWAAELLSSRSRKRGWTWETRFQDGTRPAYEIDKVNRHVVFYFHEGQQQAWDSGRQYVGVIAGKQAGKTLIEPEWLWREIQIKGPGDYLAVSANYKLFSRNFLPAMKQFFVADMKMARYWAADNKLELCDPETGEFGATFSHEDEKMWGRILLGSADSEASLQSTTGLAALMDEAGLYTATAFKDIRARLTIANGRVFIGTSIYDLGWLKQQIYDPWVNGDPEIDVIQFSSKVNPFFGEEAYERERRLLPAWQFRMDYDAEFGRPPAAIYEDFVDALREDGGHLYDHAFQIPMEWPRYVAIDPGVINPGKLWVAHDVAPDMYYIYRAEKGGERRTSKEHATFDLTRAANNRERVIAWAIGAKSEKYWREDYKRAGALNVREPDTPNVEEGIDRFGLLIRQHRVLVADDLTDFRDEILRYAREIKDGQVTENIKDKSNFHLMDAARYFGVLVVKATGRKREARLSSYIGKMR